VPSGATELRSADNATRRPVNAATTVAPPTPGLWYWMKGSDVIGAVGVRLDAGEPQLARATPTELLARFGGADHAVISSEPPAFLASVRQSGASQPVTSPLLWLALLAVLAEAWLSGRYRTGAAGAADSSVRTA